MITGAERSTDLAHAGADLIQRQARAAIEADAPGTNRFNHHPRGRDTAGHLSNDIAESCGVL
jgi:hypothetical protein